MQKMKNYLQKITNSRVAKDLSIVFTENILTRGLNFLIIIMLSRLLGPSDYGKYSFIFVAMAFCSAFFDFGMENTAVRFSNREKATKNSIFGLYFLTKFIILSVVTLTLIFFGRAIFITIHKEELLIYLPYLIVGIIGESLLFINDTYLQAVQQYVLRATINVSRYVIGLSYIIILYFKKLLLLKYVFLVYFIPLGISSLFFFKYINFLKTFFNQKLDKALFLEIVNYERWMMNSSIGTNILGRIDFLMLSFWVGYAQIGIYNAAFQLTSIVSFLPYVFGKVILPKMSGLSPEDACGFTKKLFKPVAAISLIIVCFIPLAAFVIPLVFGDEYRASIVILQVLLFAFAIAFLTFPFEQALYSLGKPKIIALGKYLQIVIIVTLNILTIPRFGMLWAAINVVIGRLFLAVMLATLFIKKEKELKNNDICVKNLVVEG
jgi:O-antigen/teichoic acid export membrane protein